MPIAHTALHTNLIWSNVSLTALGSGQMLALYANGPGGGTANAGVIGRLVDLKTGTLVGSDFLVNTSTQYPGSVTSADSAADGSALVTWNAGGPGSVLAQRFGADGQRLGGELALANGPSAGAGISQSNALALPNGKFFVSWAEPSGTSFRGGLLDAAGTALGAAATYPTGRFFVADGGHFASLRAQTTDFGVTYKTWMQLYSAETGAPVGNEISLAEVGTPGPVVALGGGRLLQTWTGRNPATGESDAFARVFDLQGAALTESFVVNTTLAGTQLLLAAQPLSDGRFALVWTNRSTDGQAGEVQAQVFNANGSKVGGEILVDAHSYFFGANKTFFVSGTTEALADGGFAIGWNTADGAYLSAFDKLGTIATAVAKPQATITGTTGADTLAAAEGVRTRFDAKGGADQITGSSNVDTVVIDATHAGLQAQGLTNEGGVIGFTTTGAGAGTAILKGVERLELKDMVLAYDTALPNWGVSDGGHVGQAYTLFSALMDRSPDAHELSVWTRKADELGSYNALAQNMIDTLKPGMDTATLVRQVGTNLVNAPVDDAFVAEFAAMVGTGKPFATASELVAAAAALPGVTAPLVALVGSVQQLQAEVFAL